MKKNIKNIIGKILNPKLILNKSEIPVFMFHRVLHEVSSELDRSITLSINEFERIILNIQKYFKILCLNEVLGKKYFLKDNSCFITFDDGWRDNYDNVFPFFQRNNIPATIFLSSKFIDTDESYWFEKLSFIINNCLNYDKNIFLNDVNLYFNKKIIDSNVYANVNIYNILIEHVKQLAPNDIDLLIKYLSKKFNFLLNEKRPRLLLNMDEIIEMGKNGIAFGSHGVNHKILTRISTQEKIFEIEQSRKKLLGLNINYVDCLSFPNGNYDQEVLDISERAGYSYLFSASINKCGEGSSSKLIHRINVTKDFVDDKFFRYTLLKAKINKKLFKYKS